MAEEAPAREEPLFTLRRERRMTRAHAVLRTLILAAMVWLVAGWALLSDRNATVFLALFAAVTTGVVCYNVALLTGTLG